MVYPVTVMYRGSGLGLLFMKLVEVVSWGCGWAVVGGVRGGGSDDLVMAEGGDRVGAKADGIEERNVWKRGSGVDVAGTAMVGIGG